MNEVPKGGQGFGFEVFLRLGAPDSCFASSNEAPHEDRTGFELGPSWPEKPASSQPITLHSEASKKVLNIAS